MHSSHTHTNTLHMHTPRHTKTKKVYHLLLKNVRSTYFTTKNGQCDIYHRLSLSQSTTYLCLVDIFSCLRVNNLNLSNREFRYLPSLSLTEAEEAHMERTANVPVCAELEECLSKSRQSAEDANRCPPKDRSTDCGRTQYFGVGPGLRANPRWRQVFAYLCVCLCVFVFVCVQVYECLRVPHNTLESLTVLTNRLGCMNEYVAQAAFPLVDPELQTGAVCANVFGCACVGV